MENKLKYKITIKTIDNESKLKIGEAIHYQLLLIAKIDYINCNINLNFGGDVIKIWIFERCKDITALLAMIRLNGKYKQPELIVEYNEEWL